jgi:hypothetical protein
MQRNFSAASMHAGVRGTPTPWEGLHETPEEAALLDAVARGEIDGDEYRRRVLADLEREIQERDRRRLIPRTPSR